MIRIFISSIAVLCLSINYAQGQYSITSSSPTSLKVEWSPANKIHLIYGKEGNHTSFTKPTDGLPPPPSPSTYTLQMGTYTLINTSTSGGSIFDVTGLSAGTSYSFVFVDYNPTGDIYTKKGETFGYTLSEVPNGKATLTVSTATENSITMAITLTTSSMSPSGYLIVRKKTNATDINIMDGTEYSTMDALTDATIVHVTDHTTGTNNYTYTDTGLNAQTEYFYELYIFNHNTAPSTFNYVKKNSESKTTKVPRPSLPINAPKVTPSSSGMTITFAHPTPQPDGYILLRFSSSSDAQTHALSDGSGVGSSPLFTQVGSSTTSNTIVDNSLSPNTTYYYALYAYNGTGLSIRYSTKKTFNGTTTCQSPTQQKSIASITATTTSTTLTWDNETTGLDGDNVLVLVSDNNNSLTNAPSPTNKTTYTASSDFSTALTFSVNTKVVYAESKLNTLGAPSVSMTNLIPLTTYYFRIYGYDGSSTCYGNASAIKNVTIPSVLLKKNSTNVVTTTIASGSTDVVLVGFSLENKSSTTEIPLTNIQLNSAYSTGFSKSNLSSFRLYRSDNDSFDITSDTDLSYTSSVTNDAITFSKTTSPFTLLTNTTVYFFLLANVNASLTAKSPTLDLSMNESSVMSSLGSTMLVQPVSISTNHSFSDTINPTFSVSYSQSIITSTSLTQIVTIVFSESMDTSIDPIIQMTQSSTLWSSSGSTPFWDLTKKKFAVEMTHNNTEENQPSVSIELTNRTALKDVSRNTLEENTLISTFEVDTKKPSVVSISLNPPLFNLTSSDLTLVINYDEDMKDTPLPLITFKDTKGFTITKSQSWKSVRQYKIVYTHDGQKETYINPEITVTRAQDIKGNNQNEKTNSILVIDTEAPIITNIKYTPLGAKNESPITIQVTFSEDIKSSPLPTLSLVTNLSDPSPTTLMSGQSMTRKDNRTYTYTYNVPPGTAEGEVRTEVSGALDVSDNPMTSYMSSKNFIIDNTAPTIATLFPANNSHNIPIKGNTFTVQFNDTNTVLLGDKTITLHHKDGSTIQSFVISSTTNIDTSQGYNFNPTNKTLTLTQNDATSLEVGTTYYLVIPLGTVVDEARNNYSGSAGKEWTFTTYGTPVIISITPKNTTVTAGCVGELLRIQGSFFTGITQINFPGLVANNPISVTNSPGVSNFTLTDDSIIEVTVPTNAQNGTIMLVRAVNGSIPKAISNAPMETDIGPSSATIALSSSAPSTVCTNGSTTNTRVEVTVVGGTGDYMLNYSVGSDTNPSRETKTGYQSGTDITVTPKVVGENKITLIMVTDRHGCGIMLDATNVNSFVKVTQNERPEVDAGGDINGQASFCLNSGNEIMLTSTFITNDPSVKKSSMYKWSTSGDGMFSNNFALNPSYTFSASDFFTQKITLTLTSTKAAPGCDEKSDELVITLEQNPTISVNTTQKVCWDGDPTNLPRALLIGTLSGGSGYTWSSKSGNNTGFSTTTSQNTEYTFTKAEANKGVATVTLAMTTPSCGKTTTLQPKELIIRIERINPNNFMVVPLTTVCTGQTVEYILSKPALTTTTVYRWTLAKDASSTSSLVENQNKATVTWSNVASTTAETLSVIETQNGCSAPTKNISITVGEPPAISIEEKGSFFSKNESDIALVGEVKPPDSAGGIFKFSGNGIVTQTNEDKTTAYYLSPSFIADKYLKDANVISKPTTITYTYVNNTTKCVSNATKIFTIYNDDKAFSITGIDGKEVGFDDSQSQYTVCSNKGPFIIKIRDAFLKAQKLSRETKNDKGITTTVNYKFKVFTVDNTKSGMPIENKKELIKNTSGKEKDNKDASAELSTALQPTSDFFTLESDGSFIIKISGWLKNPNKDSDSPSYGTIKIRVNPPPTLKIKDLSNKNICSNTSSIVLERDLIKNSRTSYEFSVHKDTERSYPGILTKNATGKTIFNPARYSSTNYDSRAIGINYSYTDANGCTNKKDDIIIFNMTQRPPSPLIKKGYTIPVFPNGGIEPDNQICVDDGSLERKSISIKNPVSGNDKDRASSNAEIKWYSESSLSNLVATTQFFQPDEKNAKYNIRLNVTNRRSYYVTQEINGCASPSTEIKYEILVIPDFSWDTSCTNRKTTFDLKLTDAQASKLTWSIVTSTNMEEPSKVVQGSPLANVQQYAYAFTQPDTYSVSSTIVTQSKCTTVKRQSVVILKSIKVTSDNPYNLKDSEFIPTTSSTPKSNASTWQYGNLKDNPDGINPPKDKSAVWITNLNGNYRNGERSFLHIGCIDISELKRPIVNFLSWTNTESKIDGVVLQYSVDNKILSNPSKEWHALGNVGSGLNWYNQSLIESLPGDKPLENYGWSGDSDEDWKSSSHSMEIIKKASAKVDPKTAILRFAFAATKSPTNKTKDGFAIRNFSIGAGTRILLLENFTSQGNKESINKEAGRITTIQNFFKNRPDNNQIVRINYHVGFAGEDPFNLDNSTEPSSRVLYYNIAKSPTTLLDGNMITENSTTFSDQLNKDFSNHILSPSQIEFVNVTASIVGNKISIEGLFTLKEDLPKGVNLFVAMVEKSIIIKKDLPASKKDMINTNHTELKYIFKKMLPSITGHSVTIQKKGDSFTFGPFTWQPNRSVLYGINRDSKNLVAIVFLQNELSKKVYHAMIIDNIDLPPIVTALKKDAPSIHNIDASIFPNPANDRIYIMLPSQAQKDMPIQLINQRGDVIYDTSLAMRKKSMSLDVKSLPEGIYTLQIKNSQGGIYATKKIIVMHSLLKQP